MRKTYAYRVVKNGKLTDPKYMGTVGGNTMEDAIVTICNRDKVELRRNGRSFDFFCNDQRVSILVWASPELFTDRVPVIDVTPPYVPECEDD